MSSTRMQVRPLTSPMMFMTSETPARSRRLSMMARSASSRLATAARPDHAADVGRDHHQLACDRSAARCPGRRSAARHRDCRSGCRRSPESGRRAGPWSGPGWRPATVIRLATSLAEIGVRPPGLPVLPGIAEIGHDRGDPPGRGAAERVDADQQLHQVVVGRIGGRLDRRRRPRRGRSRGSRRRSPCRRSGARWPGSAACRDRRRSPPPAAGCCCRRASSFSERPRSGRQRPQFRAESIRHSGLRHGEARGLPAAAHGYRALGQGGILAAASLVRIGRRAQHTIRSSERRESGSGAPLGDQLGPAQGHREPRLAVDDDHVDEEHHAGRRSRPGLSR